MGGSPSPPSLCSSSEAGPGLADAHFARFSSTGGARIGFDSSQIQFKSLRFLCYIFTKKFERVMGVEPTTSSLGSLHSTAELHPLKNDILVRNDCFIIFIVYLKDWQCESFLKIADIFVEIEKQILLTICER